MIKFIIIAALAFIILPHLLGAFGGSVIVVLGVVVLALYFLPKLRTALIGLAVVAWMLWSIGRPMYEAFRNAATEGLKRPGQEWAAAKAAGIEAAKKLAEKLGVPGLAGVAFDAGQGLSDAAEELALVQKLCETTPMAREKFGDETIARLYCQRQGLGTFKSAKEYIDGMVKGAAGAAYPFVATDVRDLEMNENYLKCLQAADQSPPPISQPCYGAGIYASRHSWRLCMELGVQLKYENDPQRPRPLAPAIDRCRKAA